MRKFEKAALAGATAVAVAFGSAAVAPAEEATPDTATVAATQATPTAGTGSAATKVGHDLEADKGADGTKIFGFEKDLASQPAWAQLFYGVTVLAGVSAFIGLIVGPLYNFIVHGPINF